MVGRSRDEDPRDASVAALMKRYGIDVDQALRVERTALHLFDQVATAWQLGPDERLMLGWAARLHEVGLVIAHSQYHVHGPYVLDIGRAHVWTPVNNTLLVCHLLIDKKKHICYFQPNNNQQKSPTT